MLQNQGLSWDKPLPDHACINLDLSYDLGHSAAPGPISTPQQQIAGLHSLAKLNQNPTNLTQMHRKKNIIFLYQYDGNKRIYNQITNINKNQEKGNHLTDATHLMK